ncbi:protein-L-isoaspartate O-methyltransferase [Streptomyces carminius]|uniref:Protein-L-isoaspartate O-methyltransferase n=1 Tax=Streptomyces carminius TaxID=2665496 RepID=A0A2M8LY98_9ACTN|nr:methyltransferase domain-containing protein [Streptomyces carminius]PJE96920.1 protein-L-isoaspartate O-methyltransferase [Streptomyces carminius]
MSEPDGPDEPDGLDRLRERLAAELAARGEWPERSPWIRRAVEALPRHLFAPDRLWRWDGSAYVPLDRSADPGGWAAEVYAGPYDPAVTQVTGGRATSSLSCQAVVVDMLDSLKVEPGHRVLELGTGTGWNAALLAHRTGPGGRVTSVEVDAEPAAQACARLKETGTTGAEVAVHVGDGAAGWPGGAPWDRVIATYAVDEIPWTWVAQTRPGGRIVAPWGRLGHVALTVAADGRSASGWLQGLAAFMPARGTDDGRTWRQIRADGAPGRTGPFPRDVRELRNGHLLFAARVLLPDVRVLPGAAGDGTAWLHDGASSWAVLATGDDGTATAHQGGPRRLADELAGAWRWWLAADRPEVYDFGMTVEPHHQHVWCRDPHTGRVPVEGGRPGYAVRRGRSRPVR